jgi:hypothetical protein
MKPLQEQKSKPNGVNQQMLITLSSLNSSFYSFYHHYWFVA